MKRRCGWSGWRQSVAEVTGAKMADLMEILDAYEFDLADYDDALIHRIVEDVKVINQDKLLIVFRGGIEIEAGI